MNRLKIAALTLAVLAVLPLAARAQGDISGDWEITLNTPQGANAVNLTLKSEADKITGDLVSPLGTVPVVGTWSGGTLAVTASINLQGTSLQLGLNGKLEGEALNGMVKFGDFGEFPFTGKRAAKAAAPAAAPATASASGAGGSGGSGGASGKWDVVLVIEGAGEFPATATLTQDGDKITGVLSSQAGDVSLNGTLTGTSLTLTFTAATPNGELPVTMTGELGAEGLAGKASIAGLGEAAWRATRSK
jgi:hypothetical protein